MNVKKAAWVMGQLKDELKRIGMNHPDFKDLYELFNSIRVQLQNLAGKP